MLLLLVFCFCFFSVNLPGQKFETGGYYQVEGTYYHKNDIQGNEFTVKEEGYVEVGDMISVDYTPARKKPPIHN